MPGWNMSEGYYSKQNISEDEIWMILNRVFSTKSHKATTYKYCFLKCLLDNLFNVDEKLTLDFNKIFTRFTEVYWNLVVKYKLRQIESSSKWQKSSVEIIIEQFLNQYNFYESFAFEALREDLQVLLIKEIGKACSKYVVGAFFADTNESFYHFTKREKWVRFNPNVYTMFVKYKKVIEKLNYYEWTKFLEKINLNESAYSIAEKLDNSSKRNNLNNYRDYLFAEINQYKCFYCQSNIFKSSVEVDHFIPWSFVKDDKLWNLVLTCKSCNNHKRDKIPDRYFKMLIAERNNIIMSTSSIPLVEDDFKGYTNEKLESMYSSAIFNGFVYGWRP